MPEDPWTAHVHVAAEREIQGLPSGEAARILDALRALADTPMGAAGLRLLTDVEPRGSFRLRVGSHRVLGVLLPHERVIYVTVVFRRAGASSYARAIRRHRARIEDAQRS